MEADPYATLEIPPHASDGEVKAAYRRLAALYHPDRNPGFQSAATERLQELNAAYELIRALRLGASRDAEAEAKAKRDAEAKARAERDAKADAKAERDANARARAARDAARKKAEVKAKRVHDAKAASRRATTEETLRRIGFLSGALASSDEVVVELLASILPEGSEIVACVRYSDFAANGPYAFPQVKRRFLRSLPLSATTGWGANAAPPIPRTQVVVCTRHLVLWTSGTFGASDGLVVEEVVTCHTARFDAILGAEVRRKGVVRVFIDDGPTLTLRVTSERASELGACIERASSSVVD